MVRYLERRDSFVLAYIGLVGAIAFLLWVVSGLTLQ
jgi:hypothetical protein